MHPDVGVGQETWHGMGAQPLTSEADASKRKRKGKGPIGSELGFVFVRFYVDVILDSQKC